MKPNGRPVRERKVRPRRRRRWCPSHRQDVDFEVDEMPVIVRGVTALRSVAKPGPETHRFDRLRVMAEPGHECPGAMIRPVGDRLSPIGRKPHMLSLRCVRIVSAGKPPRECRYLSLELNNASGGSAAVSGSVHSWKPPKASLPSRRIRPVSASMTVGIGKGLCGGGASSPDHAAQPSKIVASS